MLGLLAGANVGGNLATEFEFAGQRGYEAGGVLGALCGFAVGALAGSRMGRRSLLSLPAASGLALGIWAMLQRRSEPLPDLSPARATVVAYLHAPPSGHSREARAMTRGGGSG